MRPRSRHALTPNKKILQLLLRHRYLHKHSRTPIEGVKMHAQKDRTKKSLQLLLNYLHKLATHQWRVCDHMLYDSSNNKVSNKRRRLDRLDKKCSLLCLSIWSLSSSRYTSICLSSHSSSSSSSSSTSEVSAGTKYLRGIQGVPASGLSFK